MTCKKHGPTIFLFISILTTLMLIAGPPIGQHYEHPRLTTYPTMALCFILFLLILEVKTDRVMKGFFLIIFGTLLQGLYLIYFGIFINNDTAPDDLIEHFNTFTQVILLASAGAGGSLISVHADKTSLDNKKEPIQNQITETQKLELKQLSATVENLNKKLNIIIGATIASTLIILITLELFLNR